MAKQTIQKTTCDYCGVEIPNNYAPVEISTSVVGAYIHLRIEMATLPVFDKGKEFCTRTCAALFFLKALGYKDGEFTISD